MSHMTTITITIATEELAKLLAILPKGTTFTVGETTAPVARAKAAQEKAAQAKATRPFNCTAIVHAEGCWITKEDLKTFTAQYERQGLRSIECAQAGATSKATKALANLHASRDKTNTPPEPATPQPQVDVAERILELAFLRAEDDMGAYNKLLAQSAHSGLDMKALQLAVKEALAELVPVEAPAATAALTAYPTN